MSSTKPPGRTSHRLKSAAPLVVDDAPSVYFYRLRMGSHVQTGLAACYSLDEYDGDVILKHEKTRKDKEDDRTRHMLELGAQTGPVFLTYTAAPEIDAIAASRDGEIAVVRFHRRRTACSTPSGVCRRHRFGGHRRGDGRLPRLYIADGHHRAASAARTRAELRDMAESARGRHVPGRRVPARQVQILAYNRLVKDLAGKRPGELIEARGEDASLTPGPAVPATQGEVSMFVAGHWYTVAIEAIVRPFAQRLAGRLAAARQVLAPCLGIGDERTDKRIDFVGGGRGTGALEHAVGSGRAAVAFSLAPVSVTDLMAISDAGEIMPPKSTWFEPKLRDGLLIHEILSPASHQFAFALMLVLVADQFESSGPRRPEAGRLRGHLQSAARRRDAGRRAEAQPADVLVVRSTKVTAEMMDRAARPHRPRRRRLQHD